LKYQSQTHALTCSSTQIKHMQYCVPLCSDIFSFKDWTRNYVSSSPSVFRKKQEKPGKMVKRNTVVIEVGSKGLKQHCLVGPTDQMVFALVPWSDDCYRLKSHYKLGEEMFVG